MRNSRSKAGSSKTKVLVVTADAAFEESVRSTFASAGQIELGVISGPLSANEAKVVGEDLTVIVVDLDPAQESELAALTRLMGRLNGWPPVVVITPNFDRDTARQLLLMRVADFLVKPVQPVELVRTCARVVQAPAAPSRRRHRSSPISAPAAAAASPPSRSRPRCSCSTAVTARRGRRPAWSISISRTAPARTISISSRGSSSRRSNRAPNGSIASCSR